MRTISVSVLMACLVGLGLCTAVLAGEPLQYRLRAGDTFRLVTVTDNTLPLIGTKSYTIVANARVVSADGTGMMLAIDAFRTETDEPDETDYTIRFTCRYTPDGQPAEIVGVDQNDERAMRNARNVAMGLPPLPCTPVSVGTSWESERPLYLRHIHGIGIPRVLRLRSKYMVKDMAVGSGRRTVTLAIETAQSSGQEMEFKSAGTMTLDAATGIPLSGQLQGAVRIRVVVKHITIPFKVQISGR